MVGAASKFAYQLAQGKAVKAHRERIGMSVDKFAERHGITPRYLRKIQSGRACPSTKVILPMLADFEPADFDNFRVFLRQASSARAAVADRIPSYLPAQLQ